VPGHRGTPVTGRTMWDAFADVAAGRAYVMVVLIAAWRCRWFASLAPYGRSSPMALSSSTERCTDPGLCPLPDTRERSTARGPAADRIAPCFTPANSPPLNTSDPQFACLDIFMATELEAATPRTTT
jgi:hypothetical protein